jgi:solute carrier family 10 (sodium/bile acid cotransporter), member 7
VSQRGDLLTFIAQRWFLLSLAGGVLLALVWPGALAVTHLIDPRFFVAGALFLIAWMLSSRQLLLAVTRPWAALWAFAVSFTAVPLLARGAADWLTVSDFRIGLMVTACVPCTLSAAVLYTRMARGDEATALLTVFLTTSSSWLVTPFLLRWTTGAEVAVDTAAMMLDLVLCLVLPVCLGQAARAVGVGGLADRNRTILGVVAQLLILCAVIKAAVMVTERLRAGSADVDAWALAGMALACVVVHLAALFLGLGSSRLLGFGRPQQLAVAFACSQKTLPVGLLLLERYFSAYPLAVVPLACYHAGNLLLDALVADHLRGRGQ